MLTYGLVAVMAGYALYKERQALGCPFPPTGADCDNAHGKSVAGTAPAPSDPIGVLFAKAKRACRYSERTVTWRSSFLIAVASVIGVFFCCLGRLPTERELVVGALVVFALTYFASNFYRFHISEHAEKNAEAAMDAIWDRSSGGARGI